MASDTGVDSNSVDTVAATIAITTELYITLFVFNETGDHFNHRTGIEISPVSDGDIWLRLPGNILGQGCKTIKHVAARARAVVIEAEGEESTVDIHLIAR